MWRREFIDLSKFFDREYNDFTSGYNEGQKFANSWADNIRFCAFADSKMNVDENVEKAMTEGNQETPTEQDPAGEVRKIP